ncbi:MAG: SurA N-terminal domain-containing protein [Acidobacteriota bacterium]|nr:SurA N-terminal domain-containing protein [Acidobacteriota bacterium]
MRNYNFKIFSIAFLVIAAFTLTGCQGTGTAANSGSGSPGVDPNETAATVNGKAVKLEDVERVIKQQGQGQESKLSPLELAKARLQVLDGLIQQEVMFQKAEKEGTVPNEEDVTAEFNKQRTASGLSQEAFDKQMKDAGITEAVLRDTIKRGLAIQKLTEKITGKIEPPKDSEIEAFYSGNPGAFVKKKGVKLAAIVIDPADNGEGDTTKNEVDAVRVGNEIIAQLRQGGDFAAIAREKSEDQQSRSASGDLGYLSEEDLKQAFSPQLAATLMDSKTPIGVAVPTQAQGKFFILKIQERSDKDESLTLESPGMRQQVTDSLINARKQLLAASYQSLAMDEAKIENFLAKKVVDNPNELSGARPAGAETPSPAANTNANTAVNMPSNTNGNSAMSSNANSGAAMNSNMKANAPANMKTNANTNAR